MNRRGFFARAAAALGAVMATCSPIGIRLAEASGPKRLKVQRLHELSPETYDDWNVSLTELMEAEHVRPAIEWETREPEEWLGSPYGRAPIEDFIEADQQLQDKMWENIQPINFGRVTEVDRVNGSITVNWEGTERFAFQNIAIPRKSLGLID